MHYFNMCLYDRSNHLDCEYVDILSKITLIIYFIIIGDVTRPEMTDRSTFIINPRRTVLSWQTQVSVSVFCIEKDLTSFKLPLQVVTGTLQRITEPNTAELCTAVCLPTDTGRNSAQWMSLTDTGVCGNALVQVFTLKKNSQSEQSSHTLD